jgi:Zn-dependent protease with chaperone function
MALFSACSTTPQGRKQLTAPAPISDVYSDVDMRIQLATVANATCLGTECARNREFDQQVLRLGNRLAEAAFESDPDLSKRINRFEFVVAEKEKPGTASNASGTVVVFRGVQNLGLDDEALAFLIAREMGHVICQHHSEISSAKIIISVLASVLFPAINLLHGAALANVTSATTTTTAASTATSFIGSQVVVASIKPTQLNEADAVAVGLLAGLGWEQHEVSDALDACSQLEGDDAWAKDFRISVQHVKALGVTAGGASVNLKANPSDYKIAHYSAQNSPIQSTLLDTEDADLKIESSDKSGQIPHALIGPSTATAEPAQATDNIVVNAARNDTPLVEAEPNTGALQNQGSALDASSNLAIEASQQSNAENSDAGGSEDGMHASTDADLVSDHAEGITKAPASDASGAEILNSGTDQTGLTKESRSGASGGRSEPVASIDEKPQNTNHQNQGKPRLSQAADRPAKQSSALDSRNRQETKVKNRRGATKSPGSASIRKAKEGLQPGKLPSSTPPVAGKQENIKKIPSGKGSKPKQVSKDAKHAKAKSTPPASAAGQTKHEKSRNMP